jgi:hypothetical protein
MAHCITFEESVIIEGRLVKRDLPAGFRLAKLTWLGQRHTVQLQLQDRAIILNQVKIITRPSGRRVHLARYLIGLCAESGTLWEIFLEVVTGLKQGGFRARLALGKWLMDLIWRGLSPYQKALASQ